MNSQVRRISEDPVFWKMYRRGWYRGQIAKYYGCHSRTIGQVYEYCGLTAIGEQDKAPSDEEEEISANSLDLAPSIAVAAAIAREIYLEKLRNEPLEVTQKRVSEWRITQM